MRRTGAEFRPHKARGHREFESPPSPPHSLRIQRFSAGFARNPRVSGPIRISRGTRDRRLRAKIWRFRHFISVSNFAGAARKHRANPQLARAEGPTAQRRCGFTRRRRISKLWTFRRVREPPAL